MRRPVKNRKHAEPDIRYGSVLVSLFINKIMRDGKKSVAQRIVYSALEQMEKQLQKPALEILETAMQNVGPSMELKSRRVGGANYQVPIEVNPSRRIALAIRWVVDSARATRGKPMEQRFAEELVNAFNNTGNAVKKRNDTHRMAEANRAFAHLAW